jgi:hypothetical protein
VPSRSDYIAQIEVLAAKDLMHTYRSFQTFKDDKMLTPSSDILIFLMH